MRYLATLVLYQRFKWESQAVRVRRFIYCYLNQYSWSLVCASLVHKIDKISILDAYVKKNKELNREYSIVAKCMGSGARMLRFEPQLCCILPV